MPEHSNARLFIWFRILFNCRFYYPVFTILFLDLGLSIGEFAAEEELLLAREAAGVRNAPPTSVGGGGGFGGGLRCGHWLGFRCRLVGGGFGRRFGGDF